jgi:hypoxanthine phosphoribosyltransferase
MNTIIIKDKKFKTFIEFDSIQSRIKNISEQINIDYQDKNPIFIAVLDGSFLFASEIYKNIKIQSEITFVKFKSYKGDKQDSLSCEFMSDLCLKNRNIIILEDIVDTGNTLKQLSKKLLNLGVGSIKIASLLSKPSKHDLNIDYVGFEISDEFVVGFGLDYYGLGRNMNNISQLCD